jgi:CRISPR-associated Csx10 family RAMP protein
MELAVKPLPMTAQTCKRFKGFRFHVEKDDEERHGVADLLIPWALFKISNERCVDVISAHADCSFTQNNRQCDQILDRISDSVFYRQGHAAEIIGASKIETRIITRSGISRRRGAVQEEILYSREVLEENQVFWGRLRCDDDDLFKAFKEFLNEASEYGQIYLGGNKTRGMGRVQVRRCQIDDDEITHVQHIERLKQDVSAFTAKLKQAAQIYDIHLKHELYIPITLQADAILRQSPTAYGTRINGAFFAETLGIQGVTLVHQVAATCRVMGWNASIRLPKQAEVAIQKGSVFLLGYSEPDNAAFWEALIDMETHGVGERRHEGFGVVTVADQFHMEGNLR